jgi:hypothetical protein
MLKSIVESKSLRLVGELAFLPASSVGDDIHVFDENQSRKGTPKAFFLGLRQQVCSIIELVLFVNEVALLLNNIDIALCLFYYPIDLWLAFYITIVYGTLRPPIIIGNHMATSEIRDKIHECF